MSESLLRVGFFLDGYTLKKVNEYYRVHHRFHASLDFRGLKSWVQLQVNRYFNKANKVVELESHYYHPQRNPHIYCGTASGVFKLEFELRNAGYQVHYSERRDDDGHMGPNLSLIGDALMFAAHCKMNAVVLLSTQGQYTPLADRLRLMGIPVLLLGWNFEYPKAEHSVHWKTDTYLRDSCAHYVAMEKVMDNNPEVDVPPFGFFVRPGDSLQMKMAQRPNDRWTKNSKNRARTRACSLASSASRCGKSR